MSKIARLIWLGGGAALLTGLIAMAAQELRTSKLQSAWWGGRAEELKFEVAPGLSDAITFPGPGPYDLRLGYHLLPQQIEHLQTQGFDVAAQARQSARLLAQAERGLFLPYREKTQAGLSLRDCRGEAMLTLVQPQRQFVSFDAVPPLLVRSLLFIEDRHLLDSDPPERNPALDPERLLKATLEQLRRRLDPSQSAAGGSTLATQIEKFRHSPNGRTESVSDKWRQMASASQRAYLDGPATTAHRRQIVVDYLNTVPLAARPGFGEVHGLGDGLWAWYGREPAAVAQALAEESGAQPGDARALREQALAYKQALSLLIAQRRPAQHLLRQSGSLTRLTDSYLRLLADAGVISPALRDAALPLPLKLANAPALERPDFVQRKAVSALRGRVSALLEMPLAYDVDRLDLDVETTFDGRAQALASQTLMGLKDAAAAKAAGLYGFHKLAEGDPLRRLVFSLALFERGPQANLLRVQADNFDQPFDVNAGARLNLGSTAKLRTLIHYLELVADLHARWAELGRGELTATAPSARDALGVWARSYLLGPADHSLAAMLDAALERSYSANPDEAFFTGGGLHRFENFEPEHDDRHLTVRAAFKDSVNLVFIRLMRDIVQHPMFGGGEGGGASLLADADDPRRRAQLERFADREGAEFLLGFQRKYQRSSPAEARALLLNGLRPQASRLAAALFTLDPQASDAQLAELLNSRLGKSAPPASAWQGLRERSQALSLADRGYVAGVHPLELWLVAYLQRHPGASASQLLKDSVVERQQVYAWLFKTRHKSAQDVRLRSQLELDAFARIQKSWQRLGYPFDFLTPSYASAIGASGDRPTALAELMGILANQGQRLPQQAIKALHFARDTPYETRMAQRPSDPERVLKEEIVAVVRRALRNVVEEGTARTINKVLLDAQGQPLEVGGKTGTGDHRYRQIGRGGQLISEQVLSRSATFAFTIGEQYFGTVMAYAPYPDAARYKFTSGLVVQLLKTLGPPLLGALQKDQCPAS